MDDFAQARNTFRNCTMPSFHTEGLGNTPGRSAFYLYSQSGSCSIFSRKLHAAMEMMQTVEAKSGCLLGMNSPVGHSFLIGKMQGAHPLSSASFS